jgi:ABC-type Na+ efflux pump permease subunit
MSTTKNAQTAKADVKSDSNAQTSKREQKYSRVMATLEVLKSSPKISKKDLAEKADALYVKHGGNSKLSEAKWYANFAHQLTALASEQKVDLTKVKISK